MRRDDEEFDAAPGAHLTADSFEHLPWDDRPHDPTKLPPGLIEPYFAALIRMGVLDAWPIRSKKLNTRGSSSYLANGGCSRCDAQRKRPCQRLVSIRRRADFQMTISTTSFGFFDRGDPVGWLSFLEERMDTALADEDPTHSGI